MTQGIIFDPPLYFQKINGVYIVILHKHFETCSNLLKLSYLSQKFDIE